MVSPETVDASEVTVGAGFSASVFRSCPGIAVGGGDCSPPQAERAIRPAKRASRNAAVCPHLAVLKKHGLIWNITVL